MGIAHTKIMPYGLQIALDQHYECHGFVWGRATVDNESMGLADVYMAHREV